MDKNQSLKFNSATGNYEPLNKQEYCPARGKKTGLCYGKTYFEGKPGTASTCIENQCKYKDNLKK